MDEKEILNLLQKLELNPNNQSLKGKLKHYLKETKIINNSKVRIIGENLKIKYLKK